MSAERRPPDPDDECVIPPPMPPEVVGRYVLNASEIEETPIREYVEGQARGEHVLRLEKVKSEPVYGQVHDVWDVQTDQDRYWVITGPTNLYSQETFPSLDYTLSFHVGLMARVASLRRSDATEEERYRLAAALRCWTQASEALDTANEAEDFQAIGMRCRESLLALVHAVADSGMVPEGEDPPKRSDFIHWSELIAGTIARGGSAEQIRSYLKKIAAETWQLVAWLAHAKNAVRFDAQIAVDATQAVLSAFGSALVRFERGAPDRCGFCSSYRLVSDYRPDLEINPPWVARCTQCGAVHVGDHVLHRQGGENS